MIDFKETAPQQHAQQAHLNGQSQRLYRNRVRELRENRLMTQSQLARRARVALRTVHSVEKGLKCRMDTKRKILLALGCSFDERHSVFPE